jgi:hypothetical protein
MASIAAFKAALQTGGARANQFEMIITAPPGIDTTFTQQDYLLCKGASLPASSIADVPVQYRGKTVHFAGERTYAPWTVTFFNTIEKEGQGTTLKLREFFEQWQSLIQSYSDITGEVLHENYMASADVRQLDRNDKVAYEYKFINMYPTEVGEIALAYETENAIEEFTVTFTYDYFVSTAIKDVEPEAAILDGATTAITAD